ncbi:DTW domain-containing protein [Pseudomonas stutzeri]|uniref:tRNA-uridine aminocarboxypropyltransferase n=1 Tax=Stutzerimonas stutzeri TaxID=316 RepID=A0A2N8S7I8_STUST|nr:DTW domain-containing protein [Stutzerimonas stutzeri]MCQ4294911.1 DTW domain-containing protein [Stutzerimonas stutzeri]PNF82590.1 DTW domain-containing protein [Stutzerimonas stutzeri]
MSRPQCSRCQRPSPLCLCALIPSLDSRTRILVLQHFSEASHALNTARLAVLGLRNAQLRNGECFADDSRSDEPSYLPSYLLFPGEDAVPISTLAGADRPIRLIVPDGTWRKARKIMHVNPWLAALPRVALPEGLTSRYRLRKAPMPGALSTIEAIVAALDILEGTSRFDELLRPFDALIEGQIEAMGQEVYRRNHGK